jgi:hypothetical protein
VATAFAVTTGLRWGRIRIAVLSLIVRVAEATYASQINGSGIGKSSRPEPIFPLGEYGYRDWYWAGTTTCSTVHSDSKPAASAAWASSTAAGPFE